MQDGNVLIVRGQEVLALLAGRERDIMAKVRMAYETHAAGETALPHSVFLRFPDQPRDRIIALPAFLGGTHQLAGIKWVASFPGNHALGFDRASAVLILNSAQTGRPQAICDGTVISAKRTAASAALAAQWMFPQRQTPRLGLVGCGLINFEIVRFLAQLWPAMPAVAVYDLDSGRAEYFKQKCHEQFAGINVEVVPSVDAIVGRATLLSLATTAVQPWISDLSACPPGSVVLHISLRDLTPQVIVACDNIVDDVDHVCRAQTSIHLTEQQVGHRDFVRCTLADITRGLAPARRDAHSVAIFSPFGLGILDLAVGQLTYELALSQGGGMMIDSFLPDPWYQTPGHQRAAET
jgi:2,3-diaminopropionate biosynthesis protein SbnB